jgi:WhiB family transcriptional regulator, redox-sensing transcriptional regulator
VSDWRDSAACRGAPAGLFWGSERELLAERRRREARAKAYCARCPSRTPCQEFAIGTQQGGEIIWGGMNLKERKDERRRRSRRVGPS